MKNISSIWALISSAVQSHATRAPIAVVTQRLLAQFCVSQKSFVPFGYEWISSDRSNILHTYHNCQIKNNILLLFASCQLSVTSGRAYTRRGAIALGFFNAASARVRHYDDFWGLQCSSVRIPDFLQGRLSKRSPICYITLFAVRLHYFISNSRLLFGSASATGLLWSSSSQYAAASPFSSAQIILFCSSFVYRPCFPHIFASKFNSVPCLPSPSRRGR
jgi:hypothetical protein